MCWMFAAFLLTFGFLWWHSHARCRYFPEMMPPQFVHTSYHHLFTIWCLFPDGSIITWDSIVLVWGPLAKLLLGWFAWFAYIWMQNRPKLTTFGYVWHLPQSCFRTVEGSDAASSGSLFGGSSSSSQESQRFASKGWDVVRKFVIDSQIDIVDWK